MGPKFRCTDFCFCIFSRKFEVDFKWLLLITITINIFWKLTMCQALCFVLYVLCSLVISYNPSGWHCYYPHFSRWGNWGLGHVIYAKQYSETYMTLTMVIERYFGCYHCWSVVLKQIGETNFCLGNNLTTLYAASNLYLDPLSVIRMLTGSLEEAICLVPMDKT